MPGKSPRPPLASHKRPSRKPYLIALTGASGAVYGLRLLETLARLGAEVDVIVSAGALQVLEAENGFAGAEAGAEAGAGSGQAQKLSPPAKSAPSAPSPFPPAVSPVLPRLRLAIPPARLKRFIEYSDADLAAPPASGTYPIAGMAIVPASMKTCAAIAHGFSGTLIARAADVCLKERRRLVVVPRETPLSAIHLANLLTLSQAGATILPAMPAFYHKPQTLDDLVDFVVMKILDALGVEHDIPHAWKANKQ